MQLLNMNTCMVIQALKNTLRSCVMSYNYAILMESLRNFVGLDIKKSIDSSFVDV